MKKIILLMLVLFLYSETQAQTNISSRDSAGVPHYISIDKLGRLKLSPLSGTLPVSGGSSGDLYVTQLGSPNSYAAWPSTTGTTIDSVSFSFTPKSITFINDATVTDTLFVSSSSSFPAANTIRRLGGEGFTKFWAVTKLYYKVGTTPAASKKIRVEAN